MWSKCGKRVADARNMESGLWAFALVVVAFLSNTLKMALNGSSSSSSSSSGTGLALARDRCE